MQHSTSFGMVFDTTSANTAIENGAATLLQDQLGRKILIIACRLHIYELYLKCAFENLVQKTNKKKQIINFIIYNKFVLMFFCSKKCTRVRGRSSFVTFCRKKSRKKKKNTDELHSNFLVQLCENIKMARNVF